MKAKTKKLPANSALKYPTDPKAPPPHNLRHADISARAYRIWVQLGYPTDRDMENWLQAERELLEAGPAEMPKEPRDLEDDASLTNEADRRIEDLVEQEPPQRSSTSL